ncbi:MAG: hypothetical protein V4619_04720 [Bacteroidota bacterium]
MYRYYFKKYFLPVLLFAAIVTGLSSCDGEFATVKDPKKWHYSTIKDDMTLDTTYLAEVESDYIYFNIGSRNPGFPTLTLAKDSDGVRAYLTAYSPLDQASNGEFEADDDNKAIIEAKFDNEKALNFTAYVNGSYAQIDSTNYFIYKLKTAKKLTVRARFHIIYPDRVTQSSTPTTGSTPETHTIKKGGTHIDFKYLEFDTDSLVWNH